MLFNFNVSDSGDGFHTIALDDYEDFAQLMGDGHFRDHPEYVFRGHRDPSWPLYPSLYREMETQIKDQIVTNTTEEAISLRERAAEKTALILKHFMYGLRGTLWQEPAHELIVGWFESHYSGIPNIKDLYTDAQKTPGLWSAVMNAWATGQHHGLLTPLLDWTESMLVAFYFAFEQADDRAAGEESRVVFALNRQLVEKRCKSKTFISSNLDFVTPYVLNNPRLIAQQGLFTYSHFYQSVEEWVTHEFVGEDLPVLIRILIRNVSSKDAIRWLNRAGVSDRTLFPDIGGISKFSNRILSNDRLNYI